MATEPQSSASLRAHRRSSSWPAATAIALLLHVLLLFFARTIAKVRPTQAQPNTTVPEASFVVALAFDEPTPPKPPEAPITADRPAKPRSPRRPVSSATPARAAPAQAAPSAIEAEPERGAREAIPAPDPIDARASTPAPPEVLYGPRKAPNPTAEALTASLRGSLEQSDRSLGLGRGALISAAESYDVRTLVPPGESVATIVVDVDAQGAAIAANVGTVTSHRRAWDRIAETMLASLRGRTIGRPGAQLPTRFTVQLDVRIRLPSGARRIGECLPGQEGIACFDLSDIAAHHSLQVHARIVGEERL